MDPPTAVLPQQLEEQARAFYVRSMEELERHGVPYLVGGGYGMACHTGIQRQTKDLDLFMRQEDSRRALEVLGAIGFRTELTWPHFLVKVLHGQSFIDILYNSGNCLCPVDDAWFEHAAVGRLFGRSVPLCPAEEMIWSKAFVQERDRFDGADIMHIILRHGDRLDWRRLVSRFAGHERILLAHVIEFGYVYPADRSKTPQWVVNELFAQAQSEPAASEPLCRGMLLAPSQYTVDIARGYIDARARLPASPEAVGSGAI